MNEPKTLETSEAKPKAFAIDIQTQNGVRYKVNKDGSRLPTDAKEALGIPLFYGGIRFLSETLAGLPKDIYKRGNKKREKIEHYATELLADFPNSQQVAPYLWGPMFAQAAMYGNGYVLINRANNKDPESKVVSLHLLHSQCVKPFRSGGKQYYKVRAEIDGEIVDQDLRYDQCLHVQGFGLDGESGESVIDIMAESLGLPKKFAQFISDYFERGAATNLVFEAEGLEQEDVDAFHYSLKKNHVGINNAHTPIVVVNAKAKTLTSPLKEFAIDILRQVNVIDIANQLRLPPHVLYSLVDANNNSLEVMGTELVKYSLLPWIQKLEAELNRKIFNTNERRQGYYVKLNVEGIQRGDWKSRAEVGVMLYTNNLITKNQWLAQEDLPPDEIDGDKYFRMLNMTLSGEPTPTDAKAEKVEKAEPVQASEPTDKQAPLNGAQITSALEVIVQLRAGVLTSQAALGLLIAVGLSESTARIMVDSTIQAGPLQTVTDATPEPITAKPIEATEVTEEPSNSETETEKETHNKSIKEQYGKFIDDAVNRVRTKQLKAFADAKRKEPEKFNEWLNKFSNAQGMYLADALNPLLETIVNDVGLLSVMLQSIAEKYAAKIKEQGEAAEPSEIINQAIEKIESELKANEGKENGSN